MNVVSTLDQATAKAVRTGQLLLRYKILLSCLAMTLTAVLAVGFIAFSGLRINPFRSTTTVTVLLPESGGLLASQDVTVRGIPIGRVDSINLTDNGVAVVATFDSSAHIPSDSAVRVSGLSAAGEQYLDFRPDSHNGPFLADGDVISEEQTSAPVSLAQIIDNSRGALGQLDSAELSTMFGELRVGRDGPRKLAAIVDGASLLASTVYSVLPQTVSMLRNSRVMFTMLADVEGGLHQAATDLDSVLGGVTKMDGGFRTLVDRGNPQLAVVDDLLAENRQNIVQILGNLTTVSQIIYLRNPALEHLWRPDHDPLLDRIGTIFHDGGLWGIVDIYPRYRCDYTLPRHAPTQADFPEPYKYTYCDNPDPSLLVRGARNAPRPPGDDTAGPPPGYDPQAQTDPTPFYPPYTMPTDYGGPTMPPNMPK